VIKRALIAVYAVISVVLVAVVVAISLSPAYNVLYYFNPLVVTDEVEYAINDTPQGTLTLPHTLTGLGPGDTVSVFLESSGNRQDNLLVEVDYAQCVLSIDGKPYHSVGGPDTYPSFQKEPPRSVDIVALPNVSADTELRLDYTISSIGDSLDLQPFCSGDQNLISKRILMDNYLALVLSLMMLVAGATLAVVGLVFFSRAELAIVLFWLGLACLACGCWTFFSNDVVLLFFSQFSAFYTISLIGLYILPVPIGRFFISFLQPYNSKLLNGTFVGLCVFFTAMLVSHVSGFVSFGEAEPYFRFGGSLLAMLYVVFVLVARQKNVVLVSPLFLFVVMLVAGLSLFDACSSFIGIQSPPGAFFMVSLFLATIVIALLVWEYLNDVLNALEKNARLEADISAINRSLHLQRKHFQDFTTSVEETRRMRHDLRHQLVAIKGFISEHRDEEALEYIDNLSESIPSISKMLVCDNAAINSLAVHYIAQAEEAGILCDIKMVVPFVLGRVSDGDLSIIIGNLFENASEACMHVEPEKRFIKIRSNVAANRFTFVIDNSFDGDLNVSGTEFHSRKRKGLGVGIASVRSVVKKYEGTMKYEAESGVFKTSLYVKI
jgi:sensor histidine kinase YesM